MGAGAVIGTGGCGEIRGALGVYVVGAIDPADRAVVESHLAWCVDCREELAGLAGLPGRLGSVPAADVTMLVLDEPGPPARDEEDPPGATLRSLPGRTAAGGGRGGERGGWCGGRVPGGRSARAARRGPGAALGGHRSRP